MNIYFRAGLIVWSAGLYILSPTAIAVTPVPGTVLDIDATTPADTYLVSQGGTLNVISGTQHGTIRVSDAGSSVNLQAGSATNAITANGGSTVTVTGAAVTGTGIGAVSLNNASATLTGATVTNTGTIGSGLNVARIQSLTTGSTATVTGSTITGTQAGASVSRYSTLELTNSSLNGVGATSAGLRMFSSTVSATGSTLTGGLNGVLVSSEAGAADEQAVLNLSNSIVTGQTGAAIAVNRAVQATISIADGTQLNGQNGNILEVSGAATANVQVSNSALAGDVQVAGDSAAHLVLDRATLQGNVVTQTGGDSSLALRNASTFTGTVTNLGSMDIASDSTWLMTGDSSVGAMSLDNGTVRFDDSAGFYQLNLASLSGTGTFVMAVNFAAGLGDFLNIEGQATGTHALLISATGADPAQDSSLQVVHTGGGDARFSLIGGTVDQGTYTYGLAKVDNDWYLDASLKQISPSTSTVLALFNTAPTVWYGELTSLRTRMGELRQNPGAAGLWARAYGNKYNVAEASGVGYQQTQQGLSLGADVPLGDSQWLVGLLAGYSQSDLALDRGSSGTVYSYYAGAYATWLDAQTGYYFDGVVKANRFQNNARVNMSDGTRAKGDYDTAGLGASAEFGRHIKLRDGYFLEPFGQLSSVVIQGRDYSLNNGMQADGDRARSVLAKAGSSAGRTFELGEGRFVQPYVRAAVAHEFINNNRVEVNGSNVFNNDLSGTRGELGAGITVSLAERLQVHADFDYSKGEHIEQPWGANLGVRYSW
ncbi:autotransporter outer membrane beta-barrel domain-containing protein [Pseudomonas putida]